MKILSDCHHKHQNIFIIILFDKKKNLIYNDKRSCKIINNGWVLKMETKISLNTSSKFSSTFGELCRYGFIAFSIFILTIGVPSVAVFLGIKFLPAMILWALSDGFWLVSLFCGCVPVLCTALASGILIGCFYGARALFFYLSKLSYKKNKALKLENPTRCN